MDGLSQDVRFALRLLRRSPGFTLVAALTLALGIASTTAVFSVVNAVLLRPLRFPQPERLMAILSTAQGVKDGFGSAPGVFLDRRARATSFDIFAGAHAHSTSMIWAGAGEPRRVNIGAASFDFFRLLGVQPILGRTFFKQEDEYGRGAVALLDADFWKQNLGGNPGILGQKIILNDRPYDIIGVLPPGIRFGYFRSCDVWIPLAADPRARFGGDIVGVGRLRNGVTRASAQAELESIGHEIGREHPEDARTGVLVKPLQDWVVGDVRRTFLLLLGAVTFLLLIACANIANLMLARSTARQREMAIRASLGAGRFRLIRQTLAESLVLASIGGAIGIGLAFAAVRAIPSIRAFYIPRLDEIAIDGTVLAVAVAASVASGVLFGLAPALQIEHRHWGIALHAGASAGAAGGKKLRNALVVAQLALALVLLSGAGLMANSLLRLLNIDLGFERSNLLTVSVHLPYQKSAHAAESQRQLAAEIARIPGVQSVSAADYTPLAAVFFPYQITSERAGAVRKLEAMARHVDVNYLRVTGVSLLAGRDFERADDTRQPVPALINKTMARILFDNENPIGRRLTTNYRSRRELEVVGVTADTRQFQLTRAPGPQMYLPLVYGPASFVIARVSANAGDLSGSIRSIARRLEPASPAPGISTMDASFSREIAKPRFYLGTLGAFAAAGVLLAAIGIFGVMSYTVAQRTHEFGVRMALGAEPGDILRLVLGSGMRIATVGVALGLFGSIAATRLLAAMLYEVQPGDPLTLACVVALLAGIALLACYLASRRATSVEPIVALRQE